MKTIYFPQHWLSRCSSSVVTDCHHRLFTYFGKTRQQCTLFVSVHCTDPSTDRYLLRVTARMETVTKMDTNQLIHYSRKSRSSAQLTTAVFLRSQHLIKYNYDYSDKRMKKEVDNQTKRVGLLYKSC